MDPNARTPSGVIVTATTPDGEQVNVTEAVQALYDLVTSSMDWGSGFWSYEDALPVAEVARICGFEGIEEAERYLRNEKHRIETAAFQEANPDGARLFGAPTPHEHVWSSADRCMWRNCYVTREDAPTP